MDQEDAMRRDTNRLLLWFVPIMVLTIIMGVIGIAGNIVTILFYRGSQFTSTTTLIIGLAVVDLIVCVMSFTTVADMISIAIHARIDRYLCKMLFLFVNWSISSSAIILWPISVDRYIKMCQTQWKQFCTVRAAKIAIGTSIAAALLVSVRKLFIYDIVGVPFIEGGDVSRNLTNTTSVRYVCAFTDTVDTRPFSLAFNAIEAIGGIGILLTFVFAYGSIVKKLLEHDKAMDASGIRIKADSSTAKPGQSGDSRLDNLRSQGSSSNVAGEIDQPVTFLSNTNTDDESNQAGVEISSSQKTTLTLTVLEKAVSKPSNPPNRPNPIKQSERNLTIMMLAVTIGFFFCFIPYFLVSVIPTKFPEQRKLEGPIQIAIRSPFWNSVINPILFYVINPTYRQYVKSIVSHAIDLLYTIRI